MGYEIPKESGAGVIAGMGAPYRVRIRRELAEVKPDAGQIDGMVYVFRYGWKIEPEDSSLYVGELAMTPNDFDWPADAPAWIASGDLEPINREQAAKAVESGEALAEWQRRRLAEGLTPEDARDTIWPASEDFSGAEWATFNGPKGER